MSEVSNLSAINTMDNYLRTTPKRVNRMFGTEIDDRWKGIDNVIF